MTRIGFIGYGELGRQIDALVSPVGLHLTKLFFDDNCVRQGVVNAVPFARHADDEFSDVQFYVGLGYKYLNLRADIVARMLELGRDLPTFIHPTCYVSSSASIAKGSLLYPMCNVDKEVIIGRGVLLNNSVILSHNTTIGDGCFLSPGVVVSGFVSVGRKVFIGAGAVIANTVSIGENAMVALGTVVTKAIPDGCSAIGYPARILSRPLKLI